MRIGVACWSRGGVSLHIQQAAGLGRGAEAGGALPRPWNGILPGAEQASELASRTIPLPPAPARVRPSCRRRHSSSSTRGSGPSRAAGGGGAGALDVPQRGGQREKGGRRGLGSGAAPLLMWRRVGGGRGARMERGCQGWGGWSWVGVQESAPLQARSWETGVSGTGLVLSRLWRYGSQTQTSPSKKSRTGGQILGTTP